MDMFSALQLQDRESHDARVSKAKVAAFAVLREKMLPFLRLANSPEELQLRLDLGESLMASVVTSAAQQHNVDYDSVMPDIKVRLAAAVAETKPKTVDVESDIGGAEGKKYLETKPRKVPEEGQADDKTDVNELDAVVEEPKRHKFVQDQKLETQKENKPGSGKAKGKSFPAHSSVKTAGAPNIGTFIKYLQDALDPNEPFSIEVADDLANTFFAEYRATPEQFEEDYEFEDYGNDSYGGESDDQPERFRQQG